MKILTVAVLFLAAFTSCQTPLRPIQSFSTEELIAAAEVDQSGYSDIVTVRSMSIYQATSQPSISRLLPITDSEQFRLRSFVSKSTGLTTNQVYVYVSYRGDWRFYRSANKLGGNNLNFTEIDKSVISCSGSSFSGCLLSESFGVDITTSDFNEALENGLNFRANTSFSDRFNDFLIPSNIFKSQQILIEKLQAENL